ncbi:MAG: 3-dehydroquinate synthase [Flavobacteriaceae bacterium]|nr:3-dehydroquinate synthase [Flavobacteriaceae bacterium]
MSPSNVFYTTHAVQRFIHRIDNKKHSIGFILVDSNTKTHCLDVLLKKCPSLENLMVIEVPPGEKSKSLKTCQSIWKTLSQHAADRHSYLINLGGGMITDLGGFVASIYKRGISFYNIPTSLLGMADASVGGKTGINFELLKNQIGTITDAAMVIILPEFLKTLNQRELFSGYAEMLKSALIQDANYWKVLKKGSPIDSLFITNQIEQSIYIKSEIVSSDKYEKGQRKILNFGHTLGHAIEAHFLSSKQDAYLLHGEAIAIGMILESYMSSKLLTLSPSALEEITETFQRFYKPVKISKSQQKKIIDLLRHDKKNQEGLVQFALLEAIGKAKKDMVVVDDSMIDEAFDYYSMQSFGSH